MHLVVDLLDRSAPNASRNLLRGTQATRSAGRTPHSTPTGLPGPLDLQIAGAPTYFPPGGIWQDLSDAPTTRLGEQWELLEERQLHSPKIEWTEPDSVNPSSHGHGFVPAPTLDYRFGPVSVDWIDQPAEHPVFGASMAQSTVASPEASTSALQLPVTPSAGSSRTPNPLSRQPSHHGTNPSQPATALYVPDPASPAISRGKRSYQLGTTDLGYGTVHLYRDARDAERDLEAQRWNEVATSSSANGATDTKRPRAGSSASGDGTVAGVLAIPSYMTASDFLAFISPAVEAIESVRILRDAMPNRSLGLIRFRHPADAAAFAKEFDGRPFSHLQDREICHVARIEGVEVKKSLIPPFTFPALLPPEVQSADVHELPTCPVCLERMDSTMCVYRLISLPLR